MDLMTEVSERITDTEKRVNELLGHLEQQASLEKTLTKAGADIRSLARSTKGAVESLHSALGSFREAVEAFKRHDPRGVLDEIGKVSARIEESGQETRRALGEVVQRHMREQFDEIGKVSTRIEESSQETRRALGEVVERQFHQIQKVKQVSYVTLAIVLGLVAFLGFVAQ